MKLIYVIKSKDIEKSKDFYEIFGFSFKKEKHGNGPIHYTHEGEDIILEIYPTKKDIILEKIMFNTKYQIELRANLIGYNPTLIDSNERFTVIDPDGRTIEIWDM